MLRRVLAVLVLVIVAAVAIRLAVGLVSAVLWILLGAWRLPRQRRGNSDRCSLAALVERHRDAFVAQSTVDLTTHRGDSRSTNWTSATQRPDAA